MVSLLLSVCVSLALSQAPTPLPPDSSPVATAAGSAGDDVKKEAPKVSLGERILRGFLGKQGATVAVPLGFAIGSLVDIVIIAPIALVLVTELVPPLSPGDDDTQELTGGYAFIGVGTVLFAAVAAFWAVVALASAGVIVVASLPE